MPNNESEKKQVLLRLNKALWQDINKWADDDYRSINGQIEYILSKEVSKHYKSKSNREEVHD